MSGKGRRAVDVLGTVPGRWWWALAPPSLTAGIILLHLIPQLRRHPPAIGNDAALFLYTGRELVGGRAVYRQIWDIKPPAVHELSAICSLLAGGDPLVHYGLLSGLTIAAASGATGLLALVARRLTGSREAAFTAGVAPLAYPPFFEVASLGTRPKYFTCVFGLLCIYWYLDRRPLLSATAATVAAAFWQLGVIFPVAVLAGQFVARGADRRTLARTGLVVIATAAAFVLPIALRGALVPMVVQVGVAPFVTAESGSVLAHWFELRSVTGLSIVLVWIGAYGVVLSVTGQTGVDGQWWVAVTVPWFLLQVLRLDLDGPPDLIPLVVFSSLGVAVVSARVGGGEGSAFANGSAFVLFLIAVLVVLAVPITGGPAPAETDQNLAERLFWSGADTPRCHVQRSATEERWIERTPATPDDDTCWAPSGWRPPRPPGR